MPLTAEDGWKFVRLVNYRANIRRLMVHYNAVYARPAQRWTFHSIGIWRSHEHYFNGSTWRTRSARTPYVMRAGQ
jgi:hypothetical protein